MLTCSESVIFSVPGGVTRGVLHYREDAPATRPVLLSCPHPLLGGTPDNPVMRAIAEAVLPRAGAVFIWEYRLREDARERFWRDERATVSAPEDIEDARAAAAWLAHAGVAPRDAVIDFAGYSYGGIISMMVAGPASRVLAVAPPLSAADRELARAAITGTTVVRPGEDFALTAGEAEAFAANEGATFARIVEVPGADHFLLNHLEAVENLAREWSATG